MGSAHPTYSAVVAAEFYGLESCDVSEHGMWCNLSGSRCRTRATYSLMWLIGASIAIQYGTTIVDESSWLGLEREVDPEIVVNTARRCSHSSFSKFSEDFCTYYGLGS